MMSVYIGLSFFLADCEVEVEWSSSRDQIPRGASNLLVHDLEQQYPGSKVNMMVRYK